MSIKPGVMVRLNTCTAKSAFIRKFNGCYGMVEGTDYETGKIKVNAFGFDKCNHFLLLPALMMQEVFL